MIQWMLTIWSLVPLPFLNPDCTFRSSPLIRLKDFEHHLVDIWSEHNCVLAWILFGISLLWDWNEHWRFSSPMATAVFQICWHIECNSLTALYFRIWNSSARIPSPPLALFIVMFLNMCTPMADSCWCMAKPIQYCKVISLQLNKFILKRKDPLGFTLQDIWL